MAAITGVTGSVSFTGLGAPADANLRMTRWTANIRRDIHETSNWVDATNAKTKVGGMYDLAGSAEGFLDSGFNLVAGDASGFEAEDAAAAAIVLTASTLRTFTFTGLISNYRVTSEKNGVVTVAFDFESSGAVVPA